MATNCTWKILFLLQLIAQVFACTGRLLEPLPPPSALVVFHPAKRRSATELGNQKQQQRDNVFLLSSNHDGSPITNVFKSRPEGEESENQLVPPGSWTDPEESWNPVIGIPVAMLRWIVKGPVLAVSYVWMVVASFGFFSGEFHAIERWVELDFKHEHCDKILDIWSWGHPKGLHAYPKSPEQEAQELGEPLPSGFKSIKVYGIYYSEVLLFHAGMIVTSVIFGPFMLATMLFGYLNEITRNKAVKAFRFIVGKHNPFETRYQIANQERLEEMREKYSDRPGH